MVGGGGVGGAVCKGGEWGGENDLDNRVWVVRKIFNLFYCN